MEHHEDYAKGLEQHYGEKTGASRDVQNAVLEAFNRALFKGTLI